MHQSYALRRRIFVKGKHLHKKIQKVAALALWPCQVRKIPGSGTGSFLGRWDSPAPTNWNEEQISWSHRHFSWYLKSKKPLPPNQNLGSKKNTHLHFWSLDLSKLECLPTFLPVHIVSSMATALPQPLAHSAKVGSKFWIPPVPGNCPSPKHWFTVPRLVVNFGFRCQVSSLKCFIPEFRTWKLTAGTQMYPNVMKVDGWKKMEPFSNRWWL